MVHKEYKSIHMKIAITATTNALEAMLDPRFGRCPFFAIHDTETGSTEFIPNPNKDASEGAGPASVQMLASRKVERIISGEFGIKVKPLLEKLNIETMVLKENRETVGNIITRVNQHAHQQGGQNA